MSAYTPNDGDRADGAFTSRRSTVRVAGRIAGVVAAEPTGELRAVA
eukprot:CAMPEP_0181172346 /NCGR_PEP_ID=MMETSP1096-20121128/2402_1 /TAXON_ID=156174 ORGANISM="Chrysochromulina ericina, Strain CCMP281" /NCGR_SAMPLE_ID=MMETSP1096 /ASSEMBLY_ACC=CAM_ASM_000453 /LENGTH=45 /DNA_ID= /DNA_START= /DNA_END= /DNA_ORIENTATION=